MAFCWYAGKYMQFGGKYPGRTLATLILRNAGGAEVEPILRIQRLLETFHGCTLSTYLVSPPQLGQSSLL